MRLCRPAACLTVVALLAVAVPARAQLSPKNAAGVTYGHVHLNVTDIEAHKRLWVEVFGGVVVSNGPLTAVKFPNMLIALAQRTPTAGSQGSALDHFGFRVRSMPDMLRTLRERGFEIQREFTGVEGHPNAYVLGPDGVRFELQEDTEQKVVAMPNHVHFLTPGYKELLDWYVATFSLARRARGTIETTADAGTVNLTFATAPQPTAPTRGRAVDHIGFEIENLEAFCRQLQLKGIKLDQPFREVPAIGLKIAYITDPSGVYVELTEGYDQVLAPTSRMSTATERGGLFTGGTTLDVRVCAEIGGQLARVRSERGLTIAAAAERLLLSPRQVLALESVDQSAFYNASFYMSALRKYAAFAGLDPKLLDRAATTEPLELVPGHAKPLADIDDGPPRGARSLLAVAVSIAGLVAIAYFRPLPAARPALAPPPHPVAASSQPGPHVEPPAAVIADAASSESEPLPEAEEEQEQEEASSDEEAPDFGYVRVTHPTWVFVRYADNSTVERALGDGETAVFEFDQKPVYLVVGSPDVELTVGRHHVNVAPFIVNGQLRLGRSDLRNLLEGDEDPS